MALSRGKPFEWKEIKQSQIGHSSTGFWNKFNIVIQVEKAINDKNKKQFQCYNDL